MNKKIFRSTAAVAVAVMVLSLAVVVGMLFRVFEQKLADELELELYYIAVAVESEGEEYLKTAKDGRRLTLIDSDGTVLYDTASDAKALDNHGNREEVAEALESGRGESVRYSGTLLERTLYSALRLSDGRVIRISAAGYTSASLLLNLAQPVLMALALAVVLSFMLSSRVSKSIIRPINSINPEAPEKAEVYDELSPLLSKIAAQNKTIRSQLDRATRLQEEFRLITENMSEGFIVIDSPGNILTHNSAAQRLLQDGDSGSASFVGAGVLTLNRSPGFRESVRRALAGEHTEQLTEINGGTYKLIANPTTGDDGSVIGAVIVILDVTESADRERLRREFTSNVSHELKTPLTSISGFAEVMSSGTVPADIMVEFSKSIYAESQRLISLVSDIIRVSRLDEGAFKAEPESVDLMELNREICARLEPMARRSEVTLECYGNCEPIMGNRQVLDDMIRNLVENGIKYNKHGGSVRVVLSTAGGKTLLTVSDTGIGIPADSLNRVFERFYRVDQSHSKAVEGTGLGLSIVKHGAAYHGATVSLESTPDEGTSVTITF